MFKKSQSTSAALPEPPASPWATSIQASQMRMQIED